MQAGVLYKPRDGEWKMDVFHDVGAAMRRINELAPYLILGPDIEDARFIYGHLNDKYSRPEQPACDHVRWTTPLFDGNGRMIPAMTQPLLRALLEAVKFIKPPVTEGSGG